jgi:magnesium transporter
MLRALLYHIGRNELRPLEPAELLSSAPKAHESAEKSANGDASALRDGAAACREDEFVWVDVVAPDDADYETLQNRFGLHEVVLENLRRKEARPKIHDYGDYTYLVFHAISQTDEPRNARGADFIMAEIACLIGPDFVVTIHAEPLPPFEDLRRRWMAHPQLMQSGPAYLLYELMDETLDDYFPALDTLNTRIDHIESRLFDDERAGDHLITAEIFTLKRDLLHIRHVAGPMRDVVNVLLRRDAESGGRHYIYFQDLYDHANRIVEMADTFRDVLAGALDAFLAVESNRMNAVMKTLTSASIILLVPNLIAAIYGMNFDNMPELHLRSGYFFVLGFMALTVLGLYANFKRKGWL